MSEGKCSCGKSKWDADGHRRPWWLPPLWTIHSQANITALMVAEGFCPYADCGDHLLPGGAVEPRLERMLEGEKSDAR